jgi:tetratricopeptide (TPR) repeat protein
MPPLRAVLAAALFAACAGPARTTWSEATPPEVFVEVLPRDAQVALDGVPLGVGPRSVPVPDAQRRYTLRASAAGFAPDERSADGAQLAGARLALVLRPDGYGESRLLDYDEAAGLASAAAALVRGGRPAQAMDYAERAAELAPDAPLPRRVLGDASWALGRRQRAAAEYAAYLAAAPEAPDRPAVEARVEELRHDVTIPGVAR